MCTTAIYSTRIALANTSEQIDDVSNETSDKIPSLEFTQNLHKGEKNRNGIHSNWGTDVG